MRGKEAGGGEGGGEAYWTNDLSACQSFVGLLSFSLIIRAADLLFCRTTQMQLCIAFFYVAIYRNILFV